ncbi:hypothetical protein [Nonomuraea sp. NPDC049028]
MIPLTFRIVLVSRCDRCGQDMPADHLCPGAFAAFIADPYGSPSDIETP